VETKVNPKPTINDTTMSLQEINKLVQNEAHFIQSVIKEVQKVIIGQDEVIKRILIGMITGGHILLEGVPGLAKTLCIKTISDIVQTQFQRIQFTPDLLPSDLIGTLIYNQQKGEFIPKKGPIFANFILADEINRAPAKVQSALLEAMQEQQVTIGDTTYSLDSPFLVLATQNPLEQEGTYPLPEAQVDRFMMKVTIHYPNRDEEKRILETHAEKHVPSVKKIMSPSNIVEMQNIASQVYIDERIKGYVLDIIFATREPEKHNLDQLKTLLEYGASPRASLALIEAAKAHAFVEGRGYVIPEDIKSIGRDVLRHRLVPSFEAEAENIDSDHLIELIFSEIEVP